MAAGRSAGFGGADYGRGRFGAGRWIDSTGGGAMWSMVDGRVFIFMSNNVHHPDSGCAEKKRFAPDLKLLK